MSSNKISQIMFFVLIAAAGVMLSQLLHAQNREQRQLPPKPPAVDTENDVDAQVWQGRVIKASDSDITLKVEGEQETFDVAGDARIRRNRRPATMESLVKGDFANVKTLGRGESEVVVEIRAFALR